MTGDPWTDPDSHLGDFDADLADIDPGCVEAHVGNPNAKLTIAVEDDVERLRELGASSPRELS